MMGGTIWIDSDLDRGSTFGFTVEAGKGKEEKRYMLGQGVNWKNIRLLIVDDDLNTREYFLDITRNFGVFCDTAVDGQKALELIEKNGAYNIYFVDWQMPDMNGIELTRRIKEKEPGDSIVIMISSATDWNAIEDDAKQAGVNKFIPKPLFPSAVADIINESLGLETVAMAKTDQKDEIDNFENYHIILAEDVEINQEIVLTVLEPTKLKIDCAENGAIALRLFSEAPEKYNMIFMDVQMPEMDGYEATRKIRALEESLKNSGQLPASAKRIPIIAMTANAFREDIEKCLDAGMNDHLGKPLDFDDVLRKLRKYLLNKE
jgi:CheY-like chemotaxis protein